MDGFTGFKTATAEELPEAVAVMDPFHVVRLCGEALDQCRRRFQQIIHGHRGRSGDSLYRSVGQRGLRPRTGAPTMRTGVNPNWTSAFSTSTDSAPRPPIR